MHVGEQSPLEQGQFETWVKRHLTKAVVLLCPQEALSFPEQVPGALACLPPRSWLTSVAGVCSPAESAVPVRKDPRTLFLCLVVQGKMLNTA